VNQKKAITPSARAVKAVCFDTLGNQVQWIVSPGHATRASSFSASRRVHFTRPSRPAAARAAATRSRFKAWPSAASDASGSNQHLGGRQGRQQLQAEPSSSTLIRTAPHSTANAGPRAAAGAFEAAAIALPRC